MKILSIGNFGRGWDGSICDEAHIADALEQMGHEVVRWSREMTYVMPGDEKFKGCDFALISQYESYPADLNDKITKLGTKLVVYWAFDYQADGQEWHERLVKEADLYLSKRIADSKYPNWQWLSQDFAPKFLDKTLSAPEQDIDVLFTGSYLPWATERNETIKAVSEKFNLVVYSVNDWPDIDNLGPIMDEGLPELYARAKIVLSVDHTLEAGYWSDRNAQAMACGAFVLFRYVPLSEARFGTGVAYHYSIPDCLKSIKFFLDNPDLRREFADRGYEMAHRNLMVEHRVTELLVMLGHVV